MKTLTYGRWLTAKFRGVCAAPKCKALIPAGSAIFFFPASKKAHCRRCGDAAKPPLPDSQRV